MMLFMKIIFSLNMLSMFWWRNNIIIMLLNLELLLITLFYINSLFNQITPSISTLILLTLMVSGSSIGLSFLINLSRTYYSSNSIFLWSLTFDKIFNSIYINNFFHQSLQF